MESYAELHCHSNFSFLDGASDPEELVKVASMLGLSALAITDHNGLYAVPRFASAAKLCGLPTIYGAELTLGSSTPRDEMIDPSGDHLVVLAKGPKGYSSLSKVISFGHTANRKKGSFELSYEGLASANCGDWIILTGCRKGLVSKTLFEHGPVAAKGKLAYLCDLFGREKVFVECWDHADPLDEPRNIELVQIALSLGVELVATNNVHYATRNAARLHQILMAIRSNRPIDEIDGWLPSYPMANLRSPGEQLRRFSKFPTLVQNANDLGLECAFDLELIAPKLPDFLVPQGHDEMSFLRELTYRMAPARYGPRSNPRIPGAYEQLDYELDIISKLGFAGYFLIVWDIVEFCKANNIFCQGRGSAANSAVCYAIGITNVDPVSLKLLFERFLSPYRDGPPDIDVDIESDRREEVIQYIYRRHSRLRASQVATVVTYRSKSAVRDVAKAFGYSQGVRDSWASQVERHPGLALSIELKDASGHKVITAPKEVLDTAMQLENNPRHTGIHVGGMVICDREISEVCPIEWARMENRTVMQWDKDDCAQVGLVKFDLLGLGMLSALHEMIDLVSEFHGQEIDLALIPQEDCIYEMLSRADTIGVFQVESRAQMATLPRLKPRCFYDLVVEVALIRPGPIQGGSVHPYIRRRNGLEEVTYLHPLLENSLSKTLGIPLFQEQLMQMAIDVAGFTPGEADQLRGAMGSKRSSEKMNRLKERLFEGMFQRGISELIAGEIFAKLSAFASFGFPESHSAAFAYLVYASAWFKYHYPAAFCAGLIRAQPMGFWSPQTLVEDTKRHGVQVLTPHVNHSCHRADLEIVDNGGVALRIGVSSIRGIGETLAERISNSGPYRSIEHLARTVPLSTAQLEALAISGALDGLFADDLSLEPLDARSALWAAGPGSRYSEGLLPSMALGSKAPSLNPVSDRERAYLQLWSYGISPAGHPLGFERGELAAKGVVVASGLASLENRSRVKVAGVVTHRQRPATANGTTFISLEDETGLINIVCSKGLWIRYRSVAKLSPALVVSGRVEKVAGVINVIAEKIEKLSMKIKPISRDFH
ncbi:MAG: error-prone DNA polymerase [Acidimicrobiaceae bacterium]|nr:error-prone DNA polymerase [Acidimicrobiaceae bacterium]